MHLSVLHLKSWLGEQNMQDNFGDVVFMSEDVYVGLRPEHRVVFQPLALWKFCGTQFLIPSICQTQPNTVYHLLKQPGFLVGIQNTKTVHNLSALEMYLLKFERW